MQNNIKSLLASELTASRTSDVLQIVHKPCSVISVDYEWLVFVPEILRARNSKYIMQTRERNEERRGLDSRSHAPVTSNALGKERSSF